MKSILKRSRFLMFVALSAFTVSCSDDGKDGVDGKDGATGTANVIYSAWLNVPTSESITIDGTPGLGYNFTAPQITSEVMSTGVVLSYLKFSESNIFPLPYTSTAGGVVNTATAIPSVGNLKVFRFRHDGANPQIPLSSSTVKIRYVIIPGGVAAKQSVYSNKSYDEICAMLDIPE